MAKNKTSGGRGTNQYQVRGHSASNKIAAPDIMSQPVNSFTSSQLRMIARNRNIVQAAQNVRDQYPLARYVVFTSHDAFTERNWHEAAITDPLGFEVRLQGDLYTHGAQLLLEEIEPDLDNPEYNTLTIDLALAITLGPLDNRYSVTAEGALADPDISPERVAQLVAAPQPHIQQMAKQHPLCPAHIKAIAVLGRP